MGAHGAARAHRTRTRNLHVARRNTRFGVFWVIITATVKIRSRSFLLGAACLPLLVQSGRAASPTAAPLKCALLPEHAAMLVMQSPEAVKAKSSGGCPAADYSDKGSGMAGFQLRDLCGKSGETVIGNYLVDLSSGLMWEDSAQKTRIDSPTLRTTRVQVCSMSVRGVVPSLQPHSTARPRKATSKKKAPAKPVVTKK